MYRTLSRIRKSRLRRSRRLRDATSLNERETMADKLIIERQRTYGDAWLVTGEILKILPQTLLMRLMGNSLFFPWMMILNKTIRILWSPGKMDHWKDIEGYAKLAHSHAEMPTDQNDPKT